MARAALDMIEQCPRHSNHLDRAEWRVVTVFPRSWMAPFAVRCQDCSQQGGVGIVIIEAGRIGITKRLGDPDPNITLTPIVRKSYGEQTGT